MDPFSEEQNSPDDGNKNIDYSKRSMKVFFYFSLILIPFLCIMLYKFYIKRRRPNFIKIDIPKCTKNGKISNFLKYKNFIFEQIIYENVNALNVYINKTTTEIENGDFSRIKASNIIDINSYSGLIWSTEIYNDKFNFETLDKMLEARQIFHEIPKSNLRYSSAVKSIGAKDYSSAFSAYRSYFEFHSSDNVHNYPSILIPNQLIGLFENGEECLKNVFNKPESVFYFDMQGDGNCSYYSIIFLIFEKLKNPETQIFKNFFEPNKAEVAATKAYAEIDYFRLLAFLNVYEAGRFRKLSSYQLFEIIFYLKFLIYIKFDLNPSYKDFLIDGDSAYEFETFIGGHNKWNNDIEMLIMSSVLDVNISILKAYKQKNRQYEFTMPDVFNTQNENSNTETLHLIYKDLNHYMAVIEHNSKE